MFGLVFKFMSIHEIPKVDSSSPVEKFDHYDSRRVEFDAGSYAREFRFLGSHALDIDAREDYYKLAELLENK